MVRIEIPRLSKVFLNSNLQAGSQRASSPNAATSHQLAVKFLSTLSPLIYIPRGKPSEVLFPR